MEIPDTVDEFLKLTEGAEMTPRPETLVQIQSPPMPDTTRAQKQSVLLGVIGVAAGLTQSDDRIIQVSVVAGSVLLGIAWMVCDTITRSQRNQRIGAENITTIESAAGIKMNQDSMIQGD